MGFSFPHTPDKFTATEKTILEYMSSHRDEFLFLTIGQLSAALNISEATVSRFARHVGCEDFKHLKQVVMEQTVQKGAVQKLRNTLRSGSGELLRHCMDQQQFNLQKTLELLDQKEFDRAVQAMLAARRIFIHAKNASRSLAQLLKFRLRRIGLDVHTIPAGGSEVLEGLIPIQRDDLVILFGFSKVSSEGRAILDYGKETGFTTLLFTARLYPEKEPPADIRLFVYRGEENAYHSMSAPAAVVDALVIAFSAQMGEKAVANLEAAQKLKERYRKLI